MFLGIIGTIGMLIGSLLPIGSANGSVATNQQMDLPAEYQQLAAIPYRDYGYGMTCRSLHIATAAGFALTLTEMNIVNGYGSDLPNEDGLDGWVSDIVALYRFDVGMYFDEPWSVHIVVLHTVLAEQDGCEY